MDTLLALAIAGIATGCPNRVRAAADVPDAVATYREVLERPGFKAKLEDFGGRFG